jgi:hypothetical protein
MFSSCYLKDREMMVAELNEFQADEAHGDGEPQPRKQKKKKEEKRKFLFKRALVANWKDFSNTQ